MAKQLIRIGRDSQGAALVEFGLILPPLLLTLMGLFDMAHNMYTAQILNGVVQQAARYSTIEGAAGSKSALDAMVTKAVREISPDANVSFKRTAYREFSDVGRPEDWTDVNKNGRCDSGEPFEDANGNGKWDKKPGANGLGSARDAVLYTVTISYTRLFPIAALIPGQSRTIRMKAVTVLRNQPYASGQTQNPVTGNCK